MRSIRKLSLALAVTAIGCGPGAKDVLVPVGGSLDANIRVVNAGLSNITVSVDGATSLVTVAAGELNTIAVAAGSHSVKMSQTSDGSSFTLPVSVATGAYASLAAQKNLGGNFTAAILGDTGAIPAPGMGKLRVMHLAVNAGKLDIWRTQPDYQTPIDFMFPFNVGANSGFMQSTPGVWDVRVWKSTPGKDFDASGWNAPLDQLQVQVSAAWIRTVMVLDAPGGGVKLKVLE